MPHSASMSSSIEAWTKQNGHPFTDTVFKLLYLNEHHCILKKKKSWVFISKGPINKKVIIGLGNGLSQNRQQEIIWINEGLVYLEMNRYISRTW